MGQEIEIVEISHMQNTRKLSSSLKSNSLLSFFFFFFAAKEFVLVNALSIIKDPTLLNFTSNKSEKEKEKVGFKLFLSLLRKVGSNEGVFFNYLCSQMRNEDTKNA